MFWLLAHFKRAIQEQTMRIILVAALVGFVSLARADCRSICDDSYNRCVSICGTSYNCLQDCNQKFESCKERC